MAKIKTYANDNTINANDRLIGTDFNDSDKTKNYLISALKNYILNGLDTRPYKVYTALLSQSGTSAPVATVLENTIGNIWFDYSDVGNYYLYSDNQFTLNKTWYTRCIDLGTGGPTYRATLFDNNDLNSMNIQSEINVDTPANDILNNTPIEIRVYN